MANLSDLLGRGVRSIQTVSFSFADVFAAQQDFTIAAVDPNKTLVLMSHRAAQTNTLAAATLLNNTTVRVTKGAGSNAYASAMVHSITIIDFGPLAKSAQRGFVAGAGAASQAVAIAAVSPAKCLAVAQHMVNTGSVDVTADSSAAITGPTTLTLGNVQTNRTTHWQVIEFY